MTFLQFQKELYYISEGIVLKNSQKDLRRCKGFQKVLYSTKFFIGCTQTFLICKQMQYGYFDFVVMKILRYNGYNQRAFFFHERTQYVCLIPVIF